MLSKKSLYILELQDNKFFIGLSDNLEETYEKHLDGMHDYWTYRFKPKSIKCTMENGDVLILDQYIEEYMRIYGEDNIFYEQIPTSHYYNGAAEAAYCHEDDTAIDFVEEYYDDHYEEDNFVKNKSKPKQKNNDNNFPMKLL